MMTTSFSELATDSADTKRRQYDSNAEEWTGESTNLSSVSIVPLMPVDQDTRQRLGLETPVEVWETFADGALDIVKGDVLVVDSTEYNVRFVQSWPWEGSTYLRLIVEEATTT